MKLKNESSVTYNETNLKICQTIVISALMNTTTITNANLEENHREVNSKKLKIYFIKWKNQCGQTKVNAENITQDEKIDNFLKMLKRKKTQSKVALQPAQTNKYVQPRTSKPENGCFKFRFEAQQDIIQLQKDKLARQEKLIRDLKLKNITEEVNTSLHETQKMLRETIRKCSIQVKCKVGVPSTPDDKFQLNIDQVPKFLREMEEKANEREARRKIILERKRANEQRKKEILQYEIEMKKVLEEEERKQVISQMMERRKKELEIQNKIRIKQQKFLDDCKKADGFYANFLQKLIFRSWQKLISIKNDNLVKSEQFYKMSLMRSSYKIWSDAVLTIWNRKYCIAEEFYKNNSKRKAFKAWFKMYKTRIRDFQVAEDWSYIRLQGKAFNIWRDFTRDQFVLYLKNVQKAQRHYQNQLMINYFYRWKLLPTIVQLEKKKEIRKQKWRERVWEILPDYKPHTEE